MREKEAIYQKTRTLSRAACEELLYAASIAVYDHETLSELRTAVFENYLDGTIGADEIENYN